MQGCWRVAVFPRRWAWLMYDLARRVCTMYEVKDASHEPAKACP